MNDNSGFIIEIAHVFTKSTHLKPALKSIYKLKTTLWWFFAMNISPLISIK